MTNSRIGISRHRLLALVLFFVLYSTTTAASVEFEQFIDIGLLPNGGTFSRAFDINNSQQVTGMANENPPGGTGGFLWDPLNGIQSLPTPNNLNSYVAINEGGDLTGTWVFPNTDNFRAVRRNVDGSIAVSPTFGGNNGLSGQTAVGEDINDNGWVTGNSLKSSQFDDRGFIWNPDSGDFIDLGTLGRNGFINANAINNKNQVVGGAPDPITFNQRGFIWSDLSGMSPLENLLSGNQSEATDINEHGLVVGFGDNSVRTVAVYWEGTSATALPNLGGNFATAEAVNESGLIVGWAELPDRSERALAWKNGQLYDLNIVASSMLPSDWTLRRAYGVNDHGDIVGVADTLAGERAFLLTATVIPSPATVTMFLVPLLVLLSRRPTSGAFIVQRR